MNGSTIMLFEDDRYKEIYNLKMIIMINTINEIYNLMNQFHY